MLLVVVALVAAESDNSKEFAHNFFIIVFLFDLLRPEQIKYLPRGNVGSISTRCALRACEQTKGFLVTPDKKWCVKCKGRFFEFR